MSAVSKNVREQSVEQMVEYGTRMRQQRDAALDRAERAEAKVAEYEAARRSRSPAGGGWFFCKCRASSSRLDPVLHDPLICPGCGTQIAIPAAGTPKEADSDA